MLIIVVTENVADLELANEVKEVIKDQLSLSGYPPTPVGIASDEDVRNEDIVGYLHWAASRGV